MFSIILGLIHRFLNQAMKMFDATEVVPINFVFFTASAIIAGRFHHKRITLPVIAFMLRPPQDYIVFVQSIAIANSFKK